MYDVDMYYEDQASQAYADVQDANEQWWEDEDDEDEDGEEVD